MSLSLLEVLFAAERHLDGHFWMTVRTRLAAANLGLFFREDAADFDARDGWRDMSEGHYPEPTSHGFLVCEGPDSTEARLQVNVFRAWDPHDEPYALSWDPETKVLLAARRARLEVQFLRTRDESTEFGEEFVHAARVALDGVIDDEANGSLVLPDGSIEPYPDEEDEKTPAGPEPWEAEEKTPEEHTPAEEDDGDDPGVAALHFVLTCSSTFTPQHAYDECLRHISTLVPYKGFSEIRATDDWHFFGFADPEASGLVMGFTRAKSALVPPFEVALKFDLFKSFDPSPERIAKVHHLAHAILNELTQRLEATSRRA